MASMSWSPDGLAMRGRVRNWARLVKGILARRDKIKRETMHNRRQLHQKAMSGYASIAMFGNTQR